MVSGRHETPTFPLATLPARKDFFTARPFQARRQLRRKRPPFGSGGLPSDLNYLAFRKIGSPVGVRQLI